MHVNSSIMITKKFRMIDVISRNFFYKNFGEFFFEGVECNNWICYIELFMPF